MMDKQIENQKEIARKNKKKYQPPLRLEKHIYSNNSQDVDLFIGSPVIAITNKKGIFVIYFILEYSHFNSLKFGKLSRYGMFV
jgi:hypothetical protein